MSQTPQDHGYSWMILFSSVMLHLITIGAQGTCGMYFVEWLDTFGRGQAETSVVCTIFVGIMAFTGPCAGVFSSYFNHRISAAVGGAMMAAGYFIGAFVNELLYLYIVIGLIVGGGSVLPFSAAGCVVGDYFLKRRTLAMGIAVTGCSLGNLVFPPIQRVLIDAYGWRGALIVTSGISLNVFVFAGLLRPVEYWTKQDENKSTSKISLRESFRATLFKKATFWLFLIHTYFWGWNFTVIQMLPDYAKDSDIKKNMAALLLSVIGISSVFGRVGAALVGNLQQVNIYCLYTAANVLKGIGIIILPSYEHVAMFIVTAILYGICLGATYALYIPIVTELFGTQRLSSAFGYFLFARGLAAFSATPITGILREETGGYRIPFYLIGISSFLAAIIMAIIIGQQRCFKLKHRDIAQEVRTELRENNDEYKTNV